MVNFSFKRQSEASTLALAAGQLRLVAAGLALVGMGVLWLAMRWGVGLYSDSIVYLGTARVILEGDGVSFLDDAGIIAPVVQYPPLYPATMAVFGWFGLDPLDGARWFSVMCYGANALLVAYITYNVTSSSVASLLASLLALSAFPMVYIHSQALTEPMFIFMIFFGFCFLALYLRDSRPVMFYACVLSVGLSCLARYVGIAFILTGGMAILCLSNSSWQKRLTDAVKFSFLSSLPLAFWVLRNFILARNPVNRTFSFHPPSLQDFLPATETIAHWFIPITIVEIFPWLAPVTTMVAFIVLGWLFREAECLRSERPRLLLYCVFGYASFLLVSWTFNDQPLELDTRTFALPYVALMILTVCAATERLRRSRYHENLFWRFSVHCLLILILAVQTVNGVVWLRYSYWNGIGFTIEQWRNSELLTFVKNATTPLFIFSNAPDFIYTLTGKRAFLIPPKLLRSTQKANPRYVEETAAMGEELTRNNAVLIYFNDENRLWYLPSIKELQSNLPLRVVKRATDGAIYRLNGHGTAFERSYHSSR